MTSLIEAWNVPGTISLRVRSVSWPKQRIEGEEGGTGWKMGGEIPEINTVHVDAMKM